MKRARLSVMGRFWVPYFAALTVGALWLALSCHAAHAQTTRVVPLPRGDSALVITTLPKCTTACPDSVRLSFGSGAGKLSHVVRVKGVDTTRVALGADSLALVRGYDPYHTERKVIGLPPMKADTATLWFRSNGEPFTKNVTIAPSDSIKGVTVIRLADGTTRRPMQPRTWLQPEGMLFHPVNAVRDTVWFVAK